jgi:hypothetical protein
LRPDRRRCRQYGEDDDRRAYCVRERWCSVQELPSESWSASYRARRDPSRPPPQRLRDRTEPVSPDLVRQGEFSHNFINPRPWRKDGPEGQASCGSRAHSP